MGRLPRFRILGNINHIMIRGIGHMDLFLENADFIRYLDTIKRFQEQDDVRIPAYCLMSNHVHLLLQAPPDRIPIFLKRVGISYAAYFNGTYEHVGHVFQNRYKSEVITDGAYYLKALRYILRNPEAGGICSWQSYPWSSARSYLRGERDGITDTTFSLGMIGGREHFPAFMARKQEASADGLAEPGQVRRALNDQRALQVFRQISGMELPSELHSMEQGERDRILWQMKQAGMTIRQIERLTGINRNIVQRAR